MNVARQRRKLTVLADQCPQDHRSYVEYLIGLFDAAVAQGLPRPASEFIPMYEEEFHE
jgi:hypothetical protein